MKWIEKTFKSETAIGKDITVKLSMPVESPDFGGTECQIVFVYHETDLVVSKTIYGIDEFQSLELSFKFIRRELLEFPHTLNSHGVSVREAFPMTIDPFLGRFSRALEGFVEQRLFDFNMRRGKRLEARQKRKRR